MPSNAKPYHDTPSSCKKLKNLPAKKYADSLRLRSAKSQPTSHSTTQPSTQSTIDSTTQPTIQSSTETIIHATNPSTAQITSELWSDSALDSNGLCSVQKYVSSFGINTPQLDHTRKINKRHQPLSSTQPSTHSTSESTAQSTM